MADYRKGYKIPEDILDDIAARYIITLPSYQKNDHWRLIWQIEQAHWFYEDFYVSPPEGQGDSDDEEEQHDLKSVSINNFIKQMYNHCPQLQAEASSVDAVIAWWHQTKSVMPSIGAIVINQGLDKVLLVQSLSKKANWGFPKGKRNEKEEEWMCAVREVREETGLDVTPYLDKDAFLENEISGKKVKLYLCPGVSDESLFAPQTRGEIRDIQWFGVSCLPATRRDTTPYENIGLPPNSFFMVYPFVKPLRHWIGHYRRGRERERQQQQFTQGNMSEMAALMSLRKPKPQNQQQAYHQQPQQQYTEKQHHQYSQQQQYNSQQQQQYQQQQQQYKQQQHPQQQQQQQQQQGYAVLQRPLVPTPPASGGKQKPQQTRGGGGAGRGAGKRTGAGAEHRKDGTEQQQRPTKAEKQARRKAKKEGKRGQQPSPAVPAGGGAKVAEAELTSKTWLNFQLDVDRVMALLPLPEVRPRENWD